MTSVTFYLPYKKGVYFREDSDRDQISVVAEGLRRMRQRKKAVEALQSSHDEQHLWKCIVAFQGYRFKTISGLPFSYKIKTGRNEELTKELWIDRRESSKSLTRSSVLLALGNIKGELFNPQSSSVSSSRIIYTPSTFARTSLLHLQEVGSLQVIHPHTSTRTNLLSFLCFIILSGEGELSYEGQTYQLGEGDCVFIDCRKAYSHSTSDNLWSLQWCHFYAPFLPAVYEKYKERGGHPVFHPDDLIPFTSLLTDLYNLASSSDYIRDMRINEKLGSLLTLLMEQSWHPESVTVSRKRMELATVKEYLDEHYTEKIMLALKYRWSDPIKQK